jgi:L-histidine Nalpha-methyltransferase
MVTAQLTFERLLTSADRSRALSEDVRHGLGSRPKTLSPMWFYDARGSELFEVITRLPEYYLTRAEKGLLESRGGEIAEAAGATMLVELGSGSSAKTRFLLDAMSDTGDLQQYAALDVSGDALEEAGAGLVNEYPGLQVHGVVGDLTRHIGHLPSGDRRMLAFLGSTIGNLHPPERHTFLCGVREAMGEGDSFLLGTDLVKEPERLEAAYNDADGVTAEFNRNVLQVINRELDADFACETFEHRARWDPDRSWMAMHLVSTQECHVRMEALDLEVHFEEGEGVLTEVSTKFTEHGVADELEAAGLELKHSWTDGDFLLTLSAPQAG